MTAHIAVDQRKAEAHIGHRLTIATYGSPPVNLAIECEDCYEVVGDLDLTTERERNREAVRKYEEQQRAEALAYLAGRR